jgi:hypothetical protein
MPPLPHEHVVVGADTAGLSEGRDRFGHQEALPARQQHGDGGMVGEDVVNQATVCLVDGQGKLGRAEFGGVDVGASKMMT